MTIEVLINAGAGEIRVALVEDGKLQELSFERTIGGEDGTRGCHSRVGDVILGRVQRVMAAMQAAFIDIGMERAGFLALREARSLAKIFSDATTISDCVREGETVLVQIIKDPMGEKGARLSAGITLPGRLLVMTPGQPGLAMSRRIEDETSRACLKHLGEQMLANRAEMLEGAGFIFRTAALGATLEELTQDALMLADTWRGIDDRRKSARPPATLYHDLGPIERTMRDCVRGDVTSVLIDDATAANAARAYCRRAMPAAEAHIQLVNAPVFERYGLEDEIAALVHAKVHLPSGAWITIETTEALTAIDVNSGRFTQSGGLEETSLAVNLEAASEIGRQIRLRSIGGLIVVDFIHLSGDAVPVLAALEKSLAFDRAPVQISPMSEFGIVAITRKRVREPLARLTSAACPSCHGSGRALTPQSVGLNILRQVERQARAAPGREILAEAAPAVASWLNTHIEEVIPELARRGAGRVRFAAGPFAPEAFDVRSL